MPTFFIPTFIPIFFQIIFMCCCFVGSCFRFVHDGHAQNTNGNEVIFFKENSKKLSRGTNTTDATHGLVTYIRCAKKTTKRKATRKLVCCCLLFIYTLSQDQIHLKKYVQFFQSYTFFFIRKAFFRLSLGFLKKSAKKG